MLLRSEDTLPLFFITAVSATMLSISILTAGSMKPEQAAPRTAAVINEADVSSGVPLDQIPDPSKTLTKTVVQSSKGEMIGEVSAVEFGADGVPQVVRVATSGLFGLGTLTKSVGARDLIYVKSRNILVSRLTKAEIDALPASHKHG